MRGTTLPALVCTGLLVSCSRGYPAFQTAAISRLPDDHRMVGTWYDQAAVAMVEVTAGEPGRVDIRLWPGLRLLGARQEPDQVVLEVVAGDSSPYLLTLHSWHDRTDAAVLMRYHGKPSWCGTCTPTYVRNLPLKYVVEQRVAAAKYLVSAARDRVMNRLIDVF